jgi:dinuclear metal center YbgI/SA1388 family protein
MASRDELIAHLDELLRPGNFEDITPNGLQVPGAEEVEVVVTGVSPGAELFERAAAEGAQLVLCHHGLLGAFQPDRMTPMLKRRLQALFAADMSLAAYHLPLDAHPDVGNNALICRALGLEQGEPFGEYRGRTLGFVGRSAEGVPIAELLERCAAAFGQEPFAFEYGPETVHSLGIVSGGAPSTLTEAVAAGLDGFLTGESAEHVMLEARESGVHFIAGGHYGTETFGVRRLGDLLADRFGVRHVFVDIPNPV